MKARHPGIKFILFSSENDVHLERILARVPEFFSQEQVIRCATITTAAAALQEALSGYGIALILVRSVLEVDALVALADRLRDQSVILILDNAGQDLTHHALKLYPRYTSCFKDDYEDIFGVLDKMITKIETTIRREENG